MRGAGAAVTKAAVAVTLAVAGVNGHFIDISGNRY